MVYKNLTQRNHPFLRTKQNVVSFLWGVGGGGEGVDFFQCVLIKGVCIDN